MRRRGFEEEGLGKQIYQRVVAARLVRFGPRRARYELLLSCLHVRLRRFSDGLPRRSVCVQCKAWGDAAMTALATGKVLAGSTSLVRYAGVG